MAFNAFILDWTMEHFDLLKKELADSGFMFAKTGPEEHIRVAVPYAQVEEFAALCRAHLNAPCNYVDIQYPAEKKTVLVFHEKTFVVANRAENESAREWALARGLPARQADWPTSF